MTLRAELGDSLLPPKVGVQTSEEADDFYAKRFSPADTNTHGVIALQLQVIFAEFSGQALTSYGEGSTSGAGGSSSFADAAHVLSPSQDVKHAESGRVGGRSGSSKDKVPCRRLAVAGGKARAEQGTPRVADGMFGRYHGSE